jgi:hypothetical protein
VTRPIFGVTESPRAAAIKRKAARSAKWREAIREAAAKPWLPRMVCPDGGGRCSERCELINDCPGPVPNPVPPPRRGRLP